MTVQEKLTIFSNNIRVFDGREQLAFRQRNLCLSELIHCLLEANERREADDLYRLFLHYLPQASAMDRAQFCCQAAKHKRIGFFLTENNSFHNAESPAPGSHGRVSFVRNRYTEEAFALFAYTITGAKEYYAPAFADACEDVYDNRCEFCILPIENTENGRLFGFYAMLDRYELQICAACDLENDNGSVIRYALIGKKISDRVPHKAIWNLEFSVATEVGVFPDNILQTASCFDASLLKMDSLPVRYDDGLQRFYFTFRLNRTEALAFDLYLTMEHSRYTPIGLYPLLVSHETKRR